MAEKNRELARAEPIRGAPDADYLQKIDKLTSLLDTIRPGTGGAINFLLRDAYKAGCESGNVVLLEALRLAKQKLFYVGNLATNAHRDQENLEPTLRRIVDYAKDGQAEAEAAIQQSERT